VKISFKEKRHFISKVYGDSWQKDKKSNYYISLPFLGFGEDKDFLCEIKVEPHEK
jgi:hypothetical protein